MGNNKIHNFFNAFYLFQNVSILIEVVRSKNKKSTKIKSQNDKVCGLHFDILWFPHFVNLTIKNWEQISKQN